MTNTEIDPDFNIIRNVVLPDAKKQPDRYLVIVMAAVIEEELGEVMIMRRRRRDCSGQWDRWRRSPRRSTWGFRLGMYHEEFATMLHSIREMRNKFAHDMRLLTLESDELKAKATDLKFIERFDHPLKKRTRRDLFIGACEFALGGLSAIGMGKLDLGHRTQGASRPTGS